jgi:hypothetical protein
MVERAAGRLLMAGAARCQALTSLTYFALNWPFGMLGHLSQIVEALGTVRAFLAALSLTTANGETGIDRCRKNFWIRL